MTRVVLTGADASSRRDVRRALERAGIEVVSEAASAGALDDREVRVQVVTARGLDEPEPVEALTTREREVLQLLADGLSNRRVGEELGISEHTVKFHVAAIYGKLGASSRAQLIRRAARRGLITL
jgi:DNA-binding NarL/FixJ family response regulator